MKVSALGLRKVHLLGPLTGGGFFRTVCQYDVTDYMNVTSDATRVTCGRCLARMK